MCVFERGEVVGFSLDLEDLQNRMEANERVVKAAFEFVANFDWSASDSTSDDRWDAFFEAVESHPDWEGK